MSQDTYASEFFKTKYSWTDYGLNPSQWKWPSDPARWQVPSDYPIPAVKWFVDKLHDRKGFAYKPKFTHVATTIWN